MRVTFAGTPEFAARALDAIIAAGHQVPLVLTQPDRPAGRSQRPNRSAVKLAAIRHGLRIHQPERLKSVEQQAQVLDVPVDVMVVAAYGLILPKQILSHPAHGCLNIHGSLLPRWRGAAPIQRAILAGDRQTGVCIMQMDAGLDTGPVISAHPVDIEPGDTAGSLHDRLAATGATAIVAALAVLARDGKLISEPQPSGGATYAPKVEKREATIDWEKDAVQIERQVRAFNPAPGASTSIEGAILKIWKARVIDEATHEDAPGTLRISSGAVVVQCGKGTQLALDEVQPAAGRRMRATDYANRWTNSGPMCLGT
jgi:methionyl-tRNA formyltransferase